MAGLLDEFTSVEIEHKLEIEKFIDSDNNLCDFNFVNIYAWGRVYDLKWKIINSVAYFYNTRFKTISFRPINDLTIEQFKDIKKSVLDKIDYEKILFLNANFIKINEEYLKNEFDIELDEDNIDYIYTTEKLALLKGRKLHKKRNLIKQFKKEYEDYEVVKIDKTHFSDCFQLSEKWCEMKTGDDLGFSHEKSALKYSLDKFDELGLDGICIFHNDKLAAFSIISKLNDNIVNVHFEKFDPDYKGSAQIVNQETAKYIYENYDYEFINREQDMGIEGLKRAKKSYLPDLMSITYELIVKQK